MDLRVRHCANVLETLSHILQQAIATSFVRKLVPPYVPPSSLFSSLCPPRVASYLSASHAFRKAATTHCASVVTDRSQATPKQLCICRKESTSTPGLPVMLGLFYITFLPGIRDAQRMPGKAFNSCFVHVTWLLDACARELPGVGP